MIFNLKAFYPMPSSPAELYLHNVAQLTVHMHNIKSCMQCEELACEVPGGKHEATAWPL